MNWDKGNYSAQYSRTKSIKELSKIKSSYHRIVCKKPITTQTPQHNLEKNKSRSTITVKVKVNPQCHSQISSEISTKYSTNCAHEKCQLVARQPLSNICERMANILGAYRKKEETWKRDRQCYETHIRKLERKVNELHLRSQSRSRSKI